MKRALAVLFTVAIFAVPAQAREGFGFKKKAVEVTMTVPPATNAGARRVKVSIDNTRGNNADDAATLNRYVTEAILAGEGTLAENGKPEVTIFIALDRLDSHETFENYTTYERQQTGTKQEWNESKKKYESKPVYSQVSVQKQRKVITANLNGSYEISDRANDVASGTLDQNFRETYGEYSSAPAPTSVEDDLLKKAARTIAAQLVPTQQRVSVLVPRASFEPLIPVAESGAWDRYLAAVEAMPAMRSPKDEAYRQYALAIAKEALAYTQSDRRTAMTMLEAAAKHYDSAIAMNPGEELFRSGYSSLLSSGNIGVPLTRVNDSVARYGKWEPSGGGGRTRSVSAPSTPAPSPTPKAMRNQTVIELAKAGLGDDTIIQAIDAAARTEFDLSANGVASLSNAGVSRKVIAHMQKRTK